MNANESNRRNSYESDDELATVYERPTSQQAKDRLNNADSATLNGWDVTLDDEKELKNDDQHECESDSLDLDEDELERAKEDVAYVDALLNGKDPDNEDVATDGGVDTRQLDEDESHDVERGDKIVVDGVRESRNPMTVRVIYHSGAIKAIDQFKGKYRVSAEDVSDRVEVVDGEEDDTPDRTLNDYVDLGGLDCLQLDDEEIVTDGGSETFVAHAAERAEADARQHEIEKDYGRAVIDDCGGWNWSLSVEEDGTVRASKAIPHDGVRVFKTEDTAHSRTSRRHGSQFGLTPEQVVDRYVRHSRTPHSVDELLGDVEAARSARGVLE